MVMVMVMVMVKMMVMVVGEVQPCPKTSAVG